MKPFANFLIVDVFFFPVSPLLCIMIKLHSIFVVFFFGSFSFKKVYERKTIYLNVEMKKSISLLD